MSRWATAAARGRRDRLWLGRLRELNCFDNLVRKLAEGQTPKTVARWAMQLKIEGEAGRWSLETWRRYLQVLSSRVRRELPRVERAAPSAELKFVVDELKRLHPNEEIDPMCEAAKPVWAKVRKSIEEIDAETALKFAFVVQQGRLAEVLKLEKKTPMLVLTGPGYREVAKLKDIAAAMVKLEVGQKWMRGRGGAYPERSPADEPAETPKSE